jgi:hypothetical protein
MSSKKALRVEYFEVSQLIYCWFDCIVGWALLHGYFKYLKNGINQTLHADLLQTPFTAHGAKNSTNCIFSLPDAP